MTKEDCHSKQYPVQPSMTAASSVYGSGSNLGEMNTPLSMASNLRPRSGSAGDRAWRLLISGWNALSELLHADREIVEGQHQPLRAREARRLVEHARDRGIGADKRPQLKLMAPSGSAIDLAVDPSISSVRAA
jgi:hypothetical protein